MFLRGAGAGEQRGCVDEACAADALDPGPARRRLCAPAAALILPRPWLRSGRPDGPRLRLSSGRTRMPRPPRDLTATRGRRASERLPVPGGVCREMAGGGGGGAPCFGTGPQNWRHEPSAARGGRRRRGKKRDRKKKTEARPAEGENKAPRLRGRQEARGGPLSPEGPPSAPLASFDRTGPQSMPGQPDARPRPGPERSAVAGRRGRHRGRLRPRAPPLHLPLSPPRPPPPPPPAARPRRRPGRPSRRQRPPPPPPALAPYAFLGPHPRSRGPLTSLPPQRSPFTSGSLSGRRRGRRHRGAQLQLSLAFSPPPSSSPPSPPPSPPSTPSQPASPPCRPSSPPSPEIPPRRSLALPPPDPLMSSSAPLPTHYRLRSRLRHLSSASPRPIAFRHQHYVSLYLSISASPIRQFVLFDSSSSLPPALLLLFHVILSTI